MIKMFNSVSLSFISRNKQTRNNCKLFIQNILKSTCIKGSVPWVSIICITLGLDPNTYTYLLVARSSSSTLGR